MQTVLEGRISPTDGLREALEIVLTVKDVQNGVLTIDSETISGRVGIFCGRFITGALTTQGKRGKEAIRQLLAVKSGKFKFVDIQGPAEPELKQSLSVDLGTLLQVAEDFEQPTIPFDEALLEFQEITQDFGEGFALNFEHAEEDETISFDVLTQDLTAMAQSESPLEEIRKQQKPVIDDAPPVIEQKPPLKPDIQWPEEAEWTADPSRQEVLDEELTMDVDDFISEFRAEMAAGNNFGIEAGVEVSANKELIDLPVDDVIPEVMPAPAVDSAPAVEGPTNAALDIDFEAQWKKLAALDPFAQAALEGGVERVSLENFKTEKQSREEAKPAFPLFSAEPPKPVEPPKPNDLISPQAPALDARLQQLLSDNPPLFQEEKKKPVVAPEEQPKERAPEPLPPQQQIPFDLSRVDAILNEPPQKPSTIPDTTTANEKPMAKLSFKKPSTAEDALGSAPVEPTAPRENPFSALQAKLKSSGPVQRESAGPLEEPEEAPQPRSKPSSPNPASIKSSPSMDYDENGFPRMERLRGGRTDASMDASVPAVPSFSSNENARQMEEREEETFEPVVEFHKIKPHQTGRLSRSAFQKTLNKRDNNMTIILVLAFAAACGATLLFGSQFIHFPK